MSNRSKYRQNRNNWRRIYGLRRTKPSTVTYLDAETSGSITIDLSRTVRDRNFFQYDPKIAGDAVPEPPSPYPPHTNCPAKRRWVATEGITEEGTGVSQWDNDAGVDPYVQTTDANRPGTLTDASGSWVTFNGTTDFMEVATAGTVDYLYDSGGGSTVWVFRLPDPAPTSGRIYSAKSNIFGRGTELFIQATGDNIRFDYVLTTTPGISHTINSVTFGPTAPTSGQPAAGQIFVVSTRTDGGNNSGSLDISIWANGYKRRTNYLSTSSVGSGRKNTVGADSSGPAPYLEMDLAVAVFCDGFITDDEHVEIAAWARDNWGITTSASQNP